MACGAAGAHHRLCSPIRQRCQPHHACPRHGTPDALAGRLYEHLLGNSSSSSSSNSSRAGAATSPPRRRRRNQQQQEQQHHRQRRDDDYDMQSHPTRTGNATQRSTCVGTKGGRAAERASPDGKVHAKNHKEWRVETRRQSKRSKITIQRPRCTQRACCTHTRTHTRTQRHAPGGAQRGAYLHAHTHFSFVSEEQIFSLLSCEN